MLLDRTHRRWCLFSLIALAIGAGTFAVYAWAAPNGPSGGSIPGLIYGILGTLMMLFAWLLAGRKQVPAWRLGSAQFWLRGHIWLGLLSFPFILFHSGFGWGGLLENVLWITFGFVILSGLFGLAMQQLLPRMLTTSIPLETFGAQIPYQCRRNQFLADKLVAEAAGRLDVDNTDLKDVAEIVTRQNKWVKERNWESDFPAFLAGIYATVPLDLPKMEVDQAKRDEANGGDTTSSPAAATGPAAVADSSGEKPDKPAGTASKIEQMRAAAAKKNATEGSAHPASTTSSVLEQARAAAAAKRAAAAENPGGENAAAVETTADRPMSKLQMARAAAAAKQNDAGEGPAAGSDAPNAEQKPMSKVELARAAAAARKNVGGSAPTMPSAARSIPPAGPKPPAKKTITAAAAPPEPLPGTVDLKAFYVDTVRPWLSANGHAGARRASTTESARLFAQMRSLLPRQLHDKLDQLADFCEERRQFALQQRIHRWLHGWLLLHVPVSIALFVLVIAHVVMALRVVPF